ncbi:MAG: LLM class F420-dependent oxidoreductase [Dehalococcoidia bacterium]|nr:LLM class F420-dependent oxidoreductase [Dehalococcoidia bacterium]
MKVGVNVAVNSNTGDIGAFAKKAEDLGFESLWMAEHPIIPVATNSKYGGTPDGSIPLAMSDMADPFISLAIASGTTSKIMLGTSICLIPEHNPLVQAKQIAALDFHSGGRFIFGIGTGWLREETEIMGGDFDHRWTQAKEAIEVMKELWTKDEAEYHGHYYDFPPVRVFPKPIQSPHPPVFLGGAATNVFKRVINYGDGWMPVRATPDSVRAGRAALDELADAAGRDPNSIQILIYGASSRDEIKQMEDAGANMATVRLASTDPDKVMDGLEKLGEEMLG